MEWIMTIALSCTGFACTYFDESYFPDKETCYEALDKVKIHLSSKLATAEDADIAVAYCKPQKKKIIYGAAEDGKS